MYIVIVLALLCALIAFLIWGKIARHWVSIAIALTLLLTGALTLGEAFEYVDWDVLGLILGMSFLTIYLEQSGFATYIARYFIERFGHSTYLLMFSLSLVAGLVSVIMENVSVVILLYPVIYSIFASLNLDPVIPIIMVALSANIAGSATMIGDPPAIITAGAFKLAFMDFIFYRGKPSMFFFTLVSMVTAIAVTSYIYSNKIAKRDYLSRSVGSTITDVDNNIDNVFLAEAVVFLAVKIILLSFRHILAIPLSLTAATAVGGLTIVRLIHRDVKSVAYALKHGFEWKLLVFLLGVFMLSGAFEKHGVARLFAEGLVNTFRDNVVALTTALLYLSVALSAVLDNVPITTTMIPVVKSIAEMIIVDPVVVMWAILIGITLGGNLTYIGASANVTAVRLLEKRGHNVSFTDFIKLSVIYNTTSVVLAWILYIAIYFTL